MLIGRFLLFYAYFLVPLIEDVNYYLLAIIVESVMQVNVCILDDLDKHRIVNVAMNIAYCNC